MIEIRFHGELYDASAIDEAVKLYEPYASLTIAREASGTTVQIQANEGGADAPLIAAELANYALGRTIERTRTASTSAPKAGGAA
ncbi:MAG: HxsD-like protein [Polyangiaceae bacterium]